jgi:hypothetical protein
MGVDGMRAWTLAAKTKPFPLLWGKGQGMGVLALPAD